MMTSCGGPTKNLRIPTKCDVGPFPEYPDTEVFECQEGLFCFDRDDFESLALWRDQIYNWYRTYKEVCQ